MGLNGRINIIETSIEEIWGNISFDFNVMINIRGIIEILVERIVLIILNFFMRRNNKYEYINIPIINQDISKSEIIFENNECISSKCLILLNCNLEQEYIVSTGAAFAKDIEPYTIIGETSTIKIGDRRFW